MYGLRGSVQVVVLYPQAMQCCPPHAGLQGEGMLVATVCGSFAAARVLELTAGRACRSSLSCTRVDANGQLQVPPLTLGSNVTGCDDMKE